MTTSGVYSFSPTRDAIIARALRLCRVLGEGDTPSAGQVDAANYALNELVKSLGNVDRVGVNVVSWEIDALVIGTDSLALPPEALGVDAAFVRYNGQDTEVRGISRDEYFKIRQKGAAGRPSRFWHDKNTNSLYFHPVPDAAYSFNYAQIRQYQDFVGDTDTADFPSAATSMLSAGTAWMLAPEYGIPAADEDRLFARFDKAKKDFIVANYDHTGKERLTPVMVV